MRMRVNLFARPHRGVVVNQGPISSRSRSTIGPYGASAIWIARISKQLKPPKSMICTPASRTTRK